MQIRRKGFSLIELIIAITVIVILTVAAYIGIQKAQNLMKGNRMTNDLVAIESALNQYYHDHDKTFPLPDFSASLNMNMLCFNAEAAFSECEDAAFYQGLIDNNLLTKRYLPEIPFDPWSGTNYAYGVSADGKYFMIAGTLQNTDGTYSAYAISNLYKGYHLPSLIRAYDSQNFVMHKGDYLPYSTNPLKLSAQIVNPIGLVTVTHGVMTKSIDDTLYPGDIIETAAGATADIFFSDGSVSRLGENSRLEISEGSSAAKNSDDNIVTKIKLKLLNGKIWNKVVRLANESEFNVETTTAIAGVRGTEFGACVNDPLVCSSGEKIIIKSGKVEVSKIDAGSLPTGTPVTLAVLTNPLEIDASKTTLSSGDVQSVSDSATIDFIESNAVSLLHPGIYPYITQFEVGEAGTDSIIAKVGMNGFKSGDYNISGFEIFRKSDFEEDAERKLKSESGSGTGMVTVSTEIPAGYAADPGSLHPGEFLYDETGKAYYFAFEKPAMSGTRLPLEGIVIRAYSDEYIPGVGMNRVYSGFSWPAVGFNILDSDIATGSYIIDFTDSSFYTRLADAYECRLNITSPVSGSASVSLTPEFRWKMTGECADIDHYEIEVHEITDSTVVSDTVPASQTFFPVTAELTAETGYTLKIAAYEAGGELLAKAENTFTTHPVGAPEPVLVSIALTSDPGPWYSDGTTSHTIGATGTFDDTTTAGVTGDCVWSPSPAGTFDGYTFTPTEDFNGNVDLSCTIGSVTGTLNVTIKKVAISGIQLTRGCPVPIISNGSTCPITAMAIYNNGDTEDLTSSCSAATAPEGWYASTGTFSANVYSPPADYDGTVSIQCNVNGKTGTLSGIPVVPLRIASVTDISVDRPILNDGGVYTFSATGKMNDGTEGVDITDDCVWTSATTPKAGDFTDNLFTSDPHFFDDSLTLKTKNPSFTCTTVNGVVKSVLKTITAVPTLANTCADKGGYWDEDASYCWIIAAAKANCSTACYGLGETIGAPVACDTTEEWNGTTAIYSALGFSSSTSLGINAPENSFAPYVHNGGLRTRYSTYVPSPPTKPTFSCDTFPTGTDDERICACLQPEPATAVGTIHISPDPAVAPMVAGNAIAYTFTADITRADTTTVTTGSECAWRASDTAAGSWNGNVFTPDDEAYTGGTVTFFCDTDSDDSSAPMNSIDITISPVVTGTLLADVCNTGNGGYLDGSTCWILSAKNESCEDACSLFGSANSVTATVSCVTGDWNVDDAVCSGLKTGFTVYTTPIAKDYAPYVASADCRSRDTSCSTPYTDCPSQTCTASSPLFQRICKCSD